MATTHNQRSWPRTPRLSRFERLVVGAFCAAIILVAWGAFTLWQSMQRHRATADETLRDHAAYMATNYRSFYNAQTWYTVRALLVATQAAHESGEQPSVEELAALAVDRSYGLDLPAAIPMRAFRGSDSSWQSLTGDAEIDPDLRHSLATLTSNDLDRELYHAAVVRRAADTSLAFIARLAGGDRWVGVEIALSEMREELWSLPPQRTFSFFEEEFSAQGHSSDNDPLLPFRLRLLDADGNSLYTFGRGLDTGWVMSPGFARYLPGSQIEMMIGADAVPVLMPGGYPPAPGPRVALAITLAMTLLTATALIAWRTLSLARMRDEFTSSVSHELRTPLANIHLYAETLLLERIREPGARRAALETITRETRRLGDMVENILASARMAKADEHLEPRPDDIGKLVDEVLAAFMPVLTSRGIEVDVDRLGPDIATIDGAAVRRILVNLLDNAIRHGPSPQRLRVVVDNAQGTLLLVVEDEGPGIPMAERERVWLPYARGSSGGSGLGLAVVRYLARLHGGDAIVGDLEQGARIEVRLAAAPEAV